MSTEWPPIPSYFLNEVTPDFPRIYKDGKIKDEKTGAYQKNHAPKRPKTVLPPTPLPRHLKCPFQETALTY